MSAVLEFDDFTLDVAARRLVRNGVELHLSPKAFDLLALLVEHRDKAVSKDTLNGALWPSTFVLESNLAGLVAEVRRVLSDSAEQPRYVRTVHRFGYRFVADVRTPSRVAARPLSVHFWLVWNTRQLALTEGENIVGRAPDASVWIDATGVSRKHARITVDGSRATIEDLGSKNGTFVQDQPLTGPHVLADGDQIRVGSVVITFRIPESAESTEVLIS